LDFPSTLPAPYISFSPLFLFQIEISFTAFSHKRFNSGHAVKFPFDVLLFTHVHAHIENRLICELAHSDRFSTADTAFAFSMQNKAGVNEFSCCFNLSICKNKKGGNSFGLRGNITSREYTNEFSEKTIFRVIFHRPTSDTIDKSNFTLTFDSNTELE
jgi:hypothetical protein